MASRSTDFTGASGAWQLSAGSWTHVTDAATVGTPTNVRDTNRGRARVAAATTTTGRQTHHADNDGFRFASADVRVAVVARAGTASTPSIVLGVHVASTAVNSDRYEARVAVDGQTGKDTSLGAYIVKIVGGVTTTLAMRESGGGYDVPKYYAFRAVKLASSVCLQVVDSASPIVAADWLTALTVSDSTSGLWDAVGGVTIGENYEITDPTATTDVFYDDFLTTDIQPILATGISSTNAFGSPAVTTRATVTVAGIAPTSVVGSPAVTGRKTVNVSGIAPTSVVGAANVTPGARTITVDGVSTTVGFGTPTMAVRQTLTANGISTTVMFGAPTVAVTQTINVSGRASTSAIGLVTVLRIVADATPWTVTLTDAKAIEVLDHKVTTVRESKALVLR